MKVQYNRHHLIPGSPEFSATTKGQIHICMAICPPKLGCFLPIFQHTCRELLLCGATDLLLRARPLEQDNIKFEIVLLIGSLLEYKFLQFQMMNSTKVLAKKISKQLMNFRNYLRYTSILF